MRSFDAVILLLLLGAVPVVVRGGEILSVASMAPSSSTSASPDLPADAKTYVAETFVRLRPKDFAAEASLEILEGPGAGRRMSFWVAARGDDARYLFFQSPRRLQGMKVLALGDDLWLHSPRRDRTHRLKRRGASGSLFDSGFRVDDVVSYTDRFREASCRWTDRDPRHPSVEVTEADGERRLLVFDAALRCPRRMDVLDGEGRVLRSMVLDDFVEVSGGRAFPRSYDLRIPATGQHTRLRFEGIRVDEGLPDRLFQPLRLGGR